VSIDREELERAERYVRGRDLRTPTARELTPRRITTLRVLGWLALVVGTVYLIATLSALGRVEPDFGDYVLALSPALLWVGGVGGGLFGLAWILALTAETRPESTEEPTDQ